MDATQCDLLLQLGLRATPRCQRLCSNYLSENINSSYLSQKQDQPGGVAVSSYCCTMASVSFSFRSRCSVLSPPSFQSSILVCKLYKKEYVIIIINVHSGTGGTTMAALVTESVCEFESWLRVSGISLSHVHLSSVPTLPVFRRALKHHLFLLAYPDSSAKSGMIKPAQCISLRDTYANYCHRTARK